MEVKGETSSRVVRLFLGGNLKQVKRLLERDVVLRRKLIGGEKDGVSMKDWRERAEQAEKTVKTLTKAMKDRALGGLELSNELSKAEKRNIEAKQLIGRLNEELDLARSKIVAQQRASNPGLSVVALRRSSESKHCVTCEKLRVTCLEAQSKAENLADRLKLAKQGSVRLQQQWNSAFDTTLQVFSAGCEDLLKRVTPKLASLSGRLEGALASVPLLRRRPPPSTSPLRPRPTLSRATQTVPTPSAFDEQKDGILVEISRLTSELNELASKLISTQQQRAALQAKLEDQKEQLAAVPYKIQQAQRAALNKVQEAESEMYTAKRRIVELEGQLLKREGQVERHQQQAKVDAEQIASFKKQFKALMESASGKGKQSLTDALSESYGEVMREEMRVMKAAYELRIAAVKREANEAAAGHQKEVKLLNDRLKFARLA